MASSGPGFAPKSELLGTIKARTSSSYRPRADARGAAKQTMHSSTAPKERSVSQLTSHLIFFFVFFFVFWFFLFVCFLTVHIDARKSWS